MKLTAKNDFTWHGKAYKAGDVIEAKSESDQVNLLRNPNIVEGDDEKPAPPEGNETPEGTPGIVSRAISAVTGGGR